MLSLKFVLGGISTKKVSTLQNFDTPAKEK
jgi:hypothetical protein